LDKIALKRGELARLDGLQRKYEDCQKQLDNLPVTEKTDQEFVELLSQHRNKLDTYQKKMEQYRTYLQQMEKWDRVDRDNHMYNDMERNIAEMDIKKASLMDRLRCLVKLRDHIKQAEQQSLMDFIDSLNQHAAVYIEDFFDDDITVEMKTIQEGKTTGKEKITLHFDVQYRNMSGDLSFLSGGEKDRVNLAFTLAFSELVDTRMLLLDECISSLDGETSNVVLENLKEKYKGKLVVVVSHQANLGFFDHVIDL
jgi:DNA repair exonuclease SbcCD ATPase subunit